MVCLCLCSFLDDYKITDSSLETPNYPSAYPTNIRLSYDIPIPAGKKLVLTFVDYELQDYCGYVKLNS